MVSSFKIERDMEYTVKKLSKLSNVSVRTLHHYDEVGLLKPAFYGGNGYRYYTEKEMLQLQQILFFKELGFPLKMIKKVMGKSNFDQLSALYSHKKQMKDERDRLNQLVKTIDQTIDHLKGKRKMKDQEMYAGFVTKEKQAEYESYLKNKIGEEHPSFKEGKKNVKSWSMEDWELYNGKLDTIMQKLVKLYETGAQVGSDEMQAVVEEHFQWVSQVWTPNRESYSGLGKMYQEFEWKQFFSKYDPNHPKLATYMSEAMDRFAESKLGEGE